MMEEWTGITPTKNPLHPAGPICKCAEKDVRIAELETQLAEAREQRRCECSEEDACRFVRERDEARAQLAEARTFIQECAEDDLDRVSPGVKQQAHTILARKESE